MKMGLICACIVLCGSREASAVRLQTIRNNPKWIEATDSSPVSIQFSSSGFWLHAAHGQKLSRLNFYTHAFAHDPTGSLLLNAVMNQIQLNPIASACTINRTTESQMVKRTTIAGRKNPTQFNFWLFSISRFDALLSWCVQCVCVFSA